MHTADYFHQLIFTLDSHIPRSKQPSILYFSLSPSTSKVSPSLDQTNVTFSTQKAKHIENRAFDTTKTRVEEMQKTRRSKTFNCSFDNTFIPASLNSTIKKLEAFRF